MSNRTVNGMNFSLLGDSICATHLPRKQRSPLRYHSPTVITAPRRSWRDTLENRVRVTLSRMMPESRLLVEGIEVQRVSYYAKLVYVVDNHSGTVKLATAVAQVCALVRQREGVQA